MSRGYFITGTDTGVGKTAITAAMARALRERGSDIGVMKPVETGCARENGELRPEDALALKKASGSADPLDDISPYRFAMPLAPNIAARLEGVEIELEKIRNACARLSGRHDIMLVEGAGGILSPLTEDRTMADLIALLRLPAIIIAPSRLGAINHSLLTVHFAWSKGIDVKGIILNAVSPETEPACEYNKEEIERLSGIPVLGRVAHIKKEAPFLEEGLLEAFKSAVDLKGF